MADRTTPHESKTCAVCGREMTWRKAWANNWDTVTYCSAACRRRGRKPIDAELEAAIIDLLDRRARSATICPSEAAKAVGGDDWRDLMEPARAAARRLQAAERVVITQKGRPVDPSRAKGPIRIGRVWPHRRGPSG